MIKPNVLYRVTGRYMEGQKIVAYHLVGEDGSQSVESKERVIWLIGKGIIENMRTQVATDNSIVIRGKGINLNNLPVFDTKKKEYRNNDASIEAANGKVSVNKSTVKGIDKMGQYKLVKRIMFGNKCLGYEVKSFDGAVKRVTRANVMDLASKKLISNAVVQSVMTDGKQTMILRGVGEELSKLPVIMVDKDGKMIDNTKNNNAANMVNTVRAAYMKKNGIIRDNLGNNSIPFKSGDFIIYGCNGEIKVESRLSVEERYTKVSECNVAACDKSINMCDNYSIEVFGNKALALTPAIVKSWTILKSKRTA